MPSFADYLRRIADEGENVLRTGGEFAEGVREQFPTLISGVAAQVPAGWAGIGAALREMARDKIHKGAGRDPAAAAADAVRDAGAALTIEPKSDTGKRGLQNIGHAMEAVIDPIAEHTVRRVGEKSPAAGAGLAAIASVVGPAKAAKTRAAVQALRETPGLMGNILHDVPAKIVKRETGFDPTVASPDRMMFPGIYRKPTEVATIAAEAVPPESPLLTQLWGKDASREALAELAERTGNVEDPLTLFKSGRLITGKGEGSEAAGRVMVPRNTQRIHDIFGEAERIITPDKLAGMKGWYPLDPMYQRLAQLYGPEEALQRYNRLNTFMGVESPSTPVVDEIRRGAAANFASQDPRLWRDWLRYGKLPAEERPATVEAIFGTVPGRVSKAPQMAQQRYLRTGEHGMDSPKVPLYIAASGLPQDVLQTAMPVADAHFARGIGLADVRGGLPNQVKKSVSAAELRSVAPWWKEIAAEHGMQPVPGQAMLWNLLGRQTGVKSPLGVPKLELITDQIERRARELGTSPETVRDLFLQGRIHLGQADVLRQLQDSEVA